MLFLHHNNTTQRTYKNLCTSNRENKNNKVRIKQKYGNN